MYIDGEHTFNAVMRDLENYFPKVKIGGIIAGHDWSGREVYKAVDTFFKRKPEQIFSDDSWYFVKDVEVLHK